MGECARAPAAYAVENTRIYAYTRAHAHTEREQIIKGKCWHLLGAPTVWQMYSQHFRYFFLFLNRVSSLFRLLLYDMVAISNKRIGLFFVTLESSFTHFSTCTIFVFCHNRQATNNERRRRFYYAKCFRWAANYTNRYRSNTKCLLYTHWIVHKISNDIAFFPSSFLLNFHSYDKLSRAKNIAWVNDCIKCKWHEFFDGRCKTKKNRMHWKFLWPKFTPVRLYKISRILFKILYEIEKMHFIFSTCKLFTNINLYQIN